MDVSQIVQLIGNMGVPIAMLIVIWNQNTKLQDKMIALIEQTTQAITVLSNKLEQMIGGQE